MAFVSATVSPFLAALVVLFFLGYPRIVSAQSTCPSAQVFSSLPFEIRESFPSTLHAGDVDSGLQYCSNGVGPQNSTTLGNGRWYQYNTSVDTIITFQLKEDEGSSSTNIPNLLFFSGSCDSLQCITGGAYGVDGSFLAKADQGPFYFWIYCESSWNDECSQTGQYVFSVVLDQVPTQLTCGAAQSLTLPFEIRDSFPSSLAADVDSSLQYCSNDVGPQNSTTLGNGRWYQNNTSVDTIITFQLKEDEGSSSTNIPNLLFFSGSCDSLQCINGGAYGHDGSFLAEADKGPFYVSTEVNRARLLGLVTSTEANAGKIQIDLTIQGPHYVMSAKQVLCRALQC